MELRSVALLRIFILTVLLTLRCRSRFSATPSIPATFIPPAIPWLPRPPPYLLEALSEMTGPAANSMGPAMSLPSNRQPSPGDPLLIELQNGRYVRVNNPAAHDNSRLLNVTPNQAPANSAQAPLIAAASPASLPPAILIFRDGHSEEVRDYTIADGVLYARGDYYTDGYWNKKIGLAALNLPETLEANADRKGESSFCHRRRTKSSPAP